jgi:hypothetical protein
MDKDVCPCYENVINISKLKPDEKFVHFEKVETTKDGKIIETQYENRSFTRFTSDELEIEKLDNRKMLKSLELSKERIKKLQDLELKVMVDALKCKFRTQLRPFDEGIEKLKAKMLLEHYGYEITLSKPET